MDNLAPDGYLGCMNTCPKCAAPRVEGVSSIPFSLIKGTWFGCGSYSYADDPGHLVRRSDKCCDMEEFSQLRHKVEELQALAAKLHDIAARAIETLMSRPPQGMAGDIVSLQAELDHLKEEGK